MRPIVISFLLLATSPLCNARLLARSLHSGIVPLTTSSSISRHVKKAIEQAISSGDPASVANLLRIHKLDANVGIDWLEATPTHKAAAMGDIALLEVLVDEHGADVNRKDDMGFTPLDEAVLAKRSEVISFLRQRGAIGKAWGDGKGLPKAAPTEKLRVKTTAELWLEAAHHALYQTDIEELEYLLTEELVTIDTVDGRGETLLHVAVQARQIFIDVPTSDNVPLLKPQWEGRDEEGLKTVLALLADQVTFLIAKGADVNVKNMDRDTPLHYAVANGDEEVVRLLLDAGADIDAEGSLNHSLLYVAQHKNNVSMFKLLLRLGAVVRDKEVEGFIDWAIARRRSTFTDEQLYWDIFTYMLEYHRDGFVGLNERRETFLHHAVIYDNKEAARELVKREIYNINVRDSWGKTPLDRVRNNEEMKTLLLELGAVSADVM